MMRTAKMTLLSNVLAISVMILESWPSPAEAGKKLTASDISTALSTVLDYSGQGYEAINKNAFENSTNVTDLNLANNRIKKLPGFLFAKLANLECLNISRNRIEGGKRAFANLSHLSVLDISRNKIVRDQLDVDFLFGLTKQTRVVIKSSGALQRINCAVFGEEKPTSFQNKSERKLVTRRPSTVGHSGSSLKREPVWVVCIHNRTLQTSKILAKMDKSTSSCLIIAVHGDHLRIAEPDIQKFKKGWFPVDDGSLLRISQVTISRSGINQLTSEIVNDIPVSVTSLAIRDGVLKSIENGTLEHNGIGILDLTRNVLTEIPANAFTKMRKLRELILAENQLTRIEFVATLPPMLDTLDLSGNNIVTIAAHSFSDVENLRFVDVSVNKVRNIEPKAFENSNLEHLNLKKNNLSELEVGALVGFKRLRRLNLSHNNLTTIRLGIFDSPELRSVNLQSNKIRVIESAELRNDSHRTDIPNNAFAKLPNLRELKLAKNRLTQTEFAATLPSKLKILDLSDNKIVKIANHSFSNREELRYLYLLRNKITTIGANAFENSALSELDLRANNISKLEEKALTGLGLLKKLDLGFNHLEAIENGTFVLPTLEDLNLESNNISVIRSGAMKKCSNLRLLNIMHNPIRKLGNGELFGLPKDENCWVVVEKSPIQEIEGGLFDEV